VSSLLKREKGFTLIEIVLVLAIAGLLLVIVFLAVSGAQKSRRDSQRKGDLSRLGAQLESYASNNAGAYPAGSLQAATFTPYVPSNFNDPTTGSAYTLPSALSDAPGATAGNISYNLGAGTTCDSAANANSRVYALRMRLEQGIACVDNK